MYGRRWLGWLIVVGLWVLISLIDTAQMLFVHPQRNCIPIPNLIAVGFTDWTQWALLTPPIVWLARRVPLVPFAWGRLAVHGVASAVISLFVVLGSAHIVRLIQSTHSIPSPLDDLFQRLFMTKFILYVLIYWLVVGVTHTLDFYVRLRERELAASRLETELTQAQLEVLRMQLQPHFLFNTLNAISALMHRDVELADRMIARLGELLRSTLDNAGAAEVSLRSELDFIAPYLEIEQARLGPRLTVRIDVDPETLDAAVPNLLLQPLVENAVRHGIAPKRGPGMIEVVGRRDGDRLRLRVRDTGVGLTNGAPSKLGLGLGNTRARLQHLYGEAHSFTIAPAPGGPGVEVSLELPFREIDTRYRNGVGSESPDRR